MNTLSSPRLAATALALVLLSNACGEEQQKPAPDKPATEAQGAKSTQQVPGLAGYDAEALREIARRLYKRIAALGAQLEETKKEVRKLAAENRRLKANQQPPPERVKMPPSAFVPQDEVSLAPLRLKANQQPPPRVEFFGLGDNAHSIVYLIDATGSLIDTFPFVIMELKRSISELKDAQSFTVIFFQGEDYIEVPPLGLKEATSENKLKVIEWVDPAGGNVIPTGLSNPVKAITRALQYQPELIFLLSDNITGQGRYEIDQKQLLARIEHANSSRTIINTIQFLYPDPREKFALKPTLKLIAEQHKGQYTYIDGRELGIE